MPLPNRSEERRRYPRAEVAASAIILASDRYGGTCLVENLSAGGALLAGDCPVRVGDSLKVVLQLARQKPLILSAAVVYVRDLAGERTFAVAFKDLPSAIEDRLQDFALAHLERGVALAPNEPTQGGRTEAPEPPCEESSAESR